MGVNTPARTVLLTGGGSKFDGTRQRLMLPTEYTQMAGRARWGSRLTGSFSSIAMLKVFCRDARGLFARGLTCSKWVGTNGSKSVRLSFEKGHSEAGWRAGAGRGAPASALDEALARSSRQLPRATVGWVGGERGREK